MTLAPLQASASSTDIDWATPVIGSVLALLAAGLVTLTWRRHHAPVVQ